MKTRKCIVAALALWVGYSAPASAQPVNSDFEDGLTGWIPELPDTPIGDVSPINVLGNGLAALQEGTPSPGTPTSASRSSISQVFDLPASAERLSFRYRLSAAPIIRNSPVPPDSLSVFLSAPGAPTPILPVFYVDSDGTMQFDPANTEVSQYEDPDGLRSVIFDVSATGLGLAATGNAVTSFAVIDSFALGCSGGSAATQAARIFLALAD